MVFIPQIVALKNQRGLHSAQEDAAYKLLQDVTRRQIWGRFFEGSDSQIKLKLVDHVAIWGKDV